MGQPYYGNVQNHILIQYTVYIYTVYIVVAKRDVQVRKFVFVALY